MKYKITDIRQKSKEVKGKRELFVRIFYRTEKGYEGSVDIIKDMFNENRVREEIEFEITEMVKLFQDKEDKI